MGKHSEEMNDIVDAGSFMAIWGCNISFVDETASWRSFPEDAEGKGQMQGERPTCAIVAEVIPSEFVADSIPGGAPPSSPDGAEGNRGKEKSKSEMYCSSAGVRPPWSNTVVVFSGLVGIPPDVVGSGKVGALRGPASNCCASITG